MNPMGCALAAAESALLFGATGAEADGCVDAAEGDASAPPGPRDPAPRAPVSSVVVPADDEGEASGARFAGAAPLNVALAPPIRTVSVPGPVETSGIVT